MAQSPIPGLDVEELFDKRLASTSRAVGPSLRPNFTIPEPPGPTLRLPGPQPSTAVAVRNVPNFTMPDTGARQPYDFEMGTSKPAGPAGPGNPRVPAGGISKEAQAFQSMRAAPPNMGPQMPAGAARAPVGPYEMGRLLKPLAAGARVLGRVGGGVGTVADFNDYKIDDPEVDSSAMGTLRAVGNGDFAGAGRSLGKGLLETGMDLGSTVAKTLDYVVPGKDPVSSRYNLMLREKFGDQLIDNSGSYPGGGAGRGFVNPAPAVPAALAAAGTPQPSTQQPFSDARQGPPVSSAPDNVVTRNGNSFSGKNIREGFTYADGRQSTGNVSALPTLGYEGYAEQARRIRDLPGVGPSQSFGDGGITTGQGAGGFGGATLSSENRKAFDSASTSTNPARNVDPLAAQKLAQERELADMRERGETQRAGMRERGENARFDANQATLRRGQDVTLASSRAANAVAIAQAQREQTNKDREFGAAQTERDLAASRASQEALDKQLEARFRRTDDKGNDVADTAKVAGYKTALVSTVPALVQALRASGTPEALAKAAELEKRGISALGPGDHDRLQQLFDTRELARQTDGFLPGKSDYVHSDNLLDFAQRANGGTVRSISGRKVQLANGTTVDIDKLRYGADGNTILPNFGIPNMNLTRGLRLE